MLRAHIGGDSGQRFWDHEHDLLAAFVVLGGEQLGGLADQGGPVEPRFGAEAGHEVVVDSAGADHGVGQVDDGVAGRVQRGDGRSGCDGLAGADLAGEHADGLLVDQPSQACDGFFVAGRGEQLGGREVTAEGVAGQAEVGLQLLDHADASCSSPPSSSVVASLGVRSAKLMALRVVAACSAATSAR
jgi:hypothetical protein